MTTKEVPKDPQKVARIMQAAQHAFAKDGYRDAKTDSIAAAAKVSKGLIFHYYGSKQALYVATVQAATATIMATIDPKAYEIPTDLVALVVNGTKYKSEFGRSHPDEMQVLINAYGEVDQLPEKVQTQIKALYEQSIAVTRTMIGQVLDKMTLRPGLDRDVVIGLIMGVYNQVFAEFQAHMVKNHDVKSMDDVQWIVERAKAYMGILEYGFAET
ncbi:TetR/AcrR family transcriptional regulator [Lactiplantibacillus garii]|uniref:TetR/AcrR family transcriptional regulator n=1 Tax=Lactiplantibacillus garii TaxID=2306423 RepID=A0A3R8KKY5_9LACO|nr:TetR/AcrR family transcriptional regulator [Lactiplantibacillus garii]RRK10135.1 TetR/AcrR family transcriptional regulator [Lactiplantibacillus garii]